MKNGRIDKYSKLLILEAKQIYILRYVYPDHSFFGLAVDNNGYLQSLYSGSGALFFDTEKQAIQFIKRYRGSDLSNPDHPFRIIITSTTYPNTDFGEPI